MYYVAGAWHMPFCAVLNCDACSETHKLPDTSICLLTMTGSHVVCAVKLLAAGLEAGLPWLHLQLVFGGYRKELGMAYCLASDITPAGHYAIPSFFFYLQKTSCGCDQGQVTPL